MHARGQARISGPVNTKASLHFGSSFTKKKLREMQSQRSESVVSFGFEFRRSALQPKRIRATCTAVQYTLLVLCTPYSTPRGEAEAHLHSCLGRAERVD